MFSARRPQPFRVAEPKERLSAIRACSRKIPKFHAMMVTYLSCSMALFPRVLGLAKSIVHHDSRPITSDHFSSPPAITGRRHSRHHQDRTRGSRRAREKILSSTSIQVYQRGIKILTTRSLAVPSSMHTAIFEMLKVEIMGLVVHKK